MEDKTFTSKNIKFFFENEDDMKIVEFFTKNKKKKFSTIVKQLVLNYIDNYHSGDNNMFLSEVNPPGIYNSVLDRRDIENMIDTAIKRYSESIYKEQNIASNSGTNIDKPNITEKDEKQKEKNKRIKSSKAKNILEQIQNYDNK